MLKSARPIPPLSPLLPSHTQLLDVETEADACWVSVTVLPQTNSSAGRGTKFKVTAIMMTRRWVGGGSLLGMLA